MTWLQLETISRLLKASICHRRIDFDLRHFFVTMIVLITEPFFMEPMVDPFPTVVAVDVYPEYGSEIMLHQ